MREKHLGIHVARRATLLAVLIGTTFAGKVSGQQDNNKTKVAQAAIPGSWQVIGRATVDFGNDKDEFKVEGADRFRKLRIKAERAEIRMKDMDVYYEDGEHEDIDVRETIKAGQHSRAIDLRGNSKRIKTVKFKYETEVSRKGVKAVVILEGQK